MIAINGSSRNNALCSNSDRTFDIGAWLPDPIAPSVTTSFAPEEAPAAEASNLDPAECASALSSCAPSFTSVFTLPNKYSSHSLSDSCALSAAVPTYIQSRRSTWFLVSRPASCCMRRNDSTFRSSSNSFFNVSIFFFSSSAARSAFHTFSIIRKEPVCQLFLFKKAIPLPPEAMTTRDRSEATGAACEDHRKPLNLSVALSEGDDGIVSIYGFSRSLSVAQCGCGCGVWRCEGECEIALLLRVECHRNTVTLDEIAQRER